MIKKTLFIAITVLVGFASTKYYVSNQKTSESTLLLQNIEALTNSNEGATIVCGNRENKGPCWRRGSNLKFCGEYSYYECYATGNPLDECTHPC